MCVFMCVLFIGMLQRGSLIAEVRREREMSFFMALHYQRNYGIMHRWRAGVNTDAAKMNIFV